jgi:formyltetrahydrofolate deformylase
VARELVLTLSCPERPGTVHAVSGSVAERGCNNIDSQQYGSPRTTTFWSSVRTDEVQSSDDGAGELSWMRPVH